MLSGGMRRLARDFVRQASPAAARRSISSSNALLRRQVFAWGEAKKGALGLGPDQTSTVSYPAPIPVMISEDVKAVKCFADTSAALTETNDLYMWGDNDSSKIVADGESTKFFPYKVEGLDDLTIVDFALGAKHVLVLDSKGHVYSWGWGGSFFGGAGALGHGDKSSHDSPTRIEMFVEEGIKIKQVASGGKHSVALDEDGMVWTWGQGEYGRLGNGGSSDSMEPEPLEFFEEAGECSTISSGQSYSAAIGAEDGKLYTWGKNSHGQLGIGNPLSMGFAMEPFPRRVTEGLAEDDGIEELATGETHMLLKTKKGAFLTCGMKIFNIPTPVALEAGGVDSDIVHFAAGKNISAMVTADGNAYAWCKGRMQGHYLGHGAEGFMEGMEKHPRRIEALDDVGKVLKVACGNKHMLAIVEVNDEDNVAR